MEQMKRLHRQELENAANVTDSLRDQIERMKTLASQQKQFHEREVSNLKAALSEMQVSVEAREFYAATGARQLRLVRRI